MGSVFLVIARETTPKARSEDTPRRLGLGLGRLGLLWFRLGLTYRLRLQLFLLFQTFQFVNDIHEVHILADIIGVTGSSCSHKHLGKGTLRFSHPCLSSEIKWRFLGRVERLGEVWIVEDALPDQNP